MEDLRVHPNESKSVDILINSLVKILQDLDNLKLNHKEDYDVYILLSSHLDNTYSYINKKIRELKKIDDYFRYL